MSAVVSYGCRDREFKPSYLGQQGWDKEGRKIWVVIPDVMSRDCHYDMRKEDDRCQGCKHI